MTNVQNFKNLFNVLKVKHTFKRHWNDDVEWGKGVNTIQEQKIMSNNGEKCEFFDILNLC